jgi:hypothetical protein
MAIRTMVVSMGKQHGPNVGWVRNKGEAMAAWLWNRCHRIAVWVSGLVCAMAASSWFAIPICAILAIAPEKRINIVDLWQRYLCRGRFWRRLKQRQRKAFLQAERIPDATDTMIEEVQSTHQGAFSYVWEQPAIRALLFPSGGIGLATLLQYLQH